MLWVGVELWRSRLPAVPEPIGVKELLYALDQVISEPTQMDEASLTLSRTDEDAVGPIAVDLLDSAGWVRLGLSPRQAGSAVRYRNAVGGIITRDVLRRMRVLPTGWLAQHDGRLVFPSREGPLSPERATEQSAAKHQLKTVQVEDQPRGGVSESRVDLNQADSLELMAIRGVGPWVAGRVLTARRNWGGFSRVQQLEEALGWDSLAHVLMVHFKCAPGQVQKKCVGQLDAQSWSQLPGVGVKKGQVIARYVKHHGADLETLIECLALDSIQWENILPHLKTCTQDDTAH